MKWGIMGAANIAKKIVIPAIQRAEGAEIVAVASLSGKEKEVAETFDIPTTYESYEALLADEDVEAVYIPLPNHLHKEWTIKAAEAGKHVLCEKPAALNRQDAEEDDRGLHQKRRVLLGGVHVPVPSAARESEAVGERWSDRGCGDDPCKLLVLL